MEHAARLVDQHAGDRPAAPERRTRVPKDRRGRAASAAPRRFGL